MSVDTRQLHKDTVSCRLHYSSELLSQINLKCKPKLSNEKLISVKKILNFEKIKRNKAPQKKYASIQNSLSSNMSKSQNEQKLFQNCNSNKFGSSNSPPSSPKCKADNFSSENIHLYKNLPHAIPNSNDSCLSRKLPSEKNPNIMYCNARPKPITDGGGIGPKKSPLILGDNLKNCEPFQSGKNSEVAKTTGGGKGKILSGNQGSNPTSDTDSFCFRVLSHEDSLSKPITLKKTVPKTKKTGMVCENCQNPLLGLINDHTYSKEGVSKISQQYKFMKTASKPELGKLKIFSLNVGGLKSKLISDELEKEMLNFDIVCLSEVKMDLCDVGVLKTDFEQFTIFSNIKDEYNFKPRGGIVIFLKNYLADSIKMLSTNKLAVSIEINSQILETEKNVVLSAIYIPPAGTAYSSEEDFDLIENMLHDWQVLNKNIILTGDFNAKTKNECDYLTLNMHDAFENLEGIFDQIVIKNDRKNQDTHDVDLFGRKLINLCKISNLQIVNGRLGRDAGLGKCTTKNNSLIDYTIASPELFNEIKDFEILDFNNFMSDVHNPMIFSLTCSAKEPETKNMGVRVSKIKWDGSKNCEFLRNINDHDVVSLLSLIENFNPNNISDESNVDLFIQKLNDILEKAKQKTFQPKTFVPSNTKTKSWYDKELTVAKNKFHSARKNKNRENIRKTSKNYKSLLISKSQGFLEKRRKRLKQTKVKNPRIYWEMIKGRAKGSHIANLSVEEFGNFFKNLNSQEESSTSNLSLETPQKDPFDELNAPFTENELKKALKNLKNNKSTGPDDILNEQIKTSFPKMKDIYLKLFNTILESGCYPEGWAEGMIVPIFKNKGSKNDPNNYRGITLLSCMSKYFNSVLNNRLKEVAEKILSLIQAGFRPGFSTMDHAFTLLCIFALYERLQKNLFVAFIDYQKAFDTVWRAGLWLKLINEGVTGRFLNVIKDMYAKSKSCVLFNNQKSENFGSFAGVRQGEILSPLLFAFYINDLEGYLRGKGVSSLRGLLSTSGEVTDFNELDMVLFLDILTLFYADDTIIFSDTALGLQFALEELQNYCEKWKLTVNEGKTKIMCITWGRYKKQKYDFIYNNQKLECVDEFIYLGICFSKKGLTSSSITNRETASKKAMFGFLTRCKQNHLPIEDQLDVFQKTVVPCMLYGGNSGVSIKLSVWK